MQFTFLKFIGVPLLICSCMAKESAPSVPSIITETEQRQLPPSKVRENLKDLQSKLKEFSNTTVIEMMSLIDRANVLVDTIEAINSGHTSQSAERIARANTVTVRYETELKNILQRLEELRKRGESEEKSESQGKVSVGYKTQFYTPRERQRKRYFDETIDDSAIQTPGSQTIVSVTHNSNNQQNDLPKE